jgi:signal transduction histidine kinase
LAASLDDVTTIQQVARLAVSFIAHCCIVDLVDENQRLSATALAHRDPVQEEALRAYRRGFPLDVSAHPPLAAVLQTGQAAIYPDLTDSKQLASTRPKEQLAAERALGFRSGMFVPLVARGRTLGAICFFAAGSGRPFGPADLARATELARRAALAIDNAQLYRQATEAIRLRDAALSTVAHDLRNPLTAIRLITDTVRLHLTRLSGPGRDEVEADLGRIDASVQRVAAQTDELLDVARLQNGQPLQLRRRRTDLVGLVRALLSDYQERTRRHRLVVEAGAPELAGLWDADRLGRVIGNLLDNAIKYSPAGGEIAVSLAQQADAGMEWAVLTVQDSGLGIPAADLPRVFDWFHRAQNVRAEVKGTGIGLASAQRIVEHHGGVLEVASGEGVGSTFTVRLPLARLAEENPLGSDDGGVGDESLPGQDSRCRG